MQATKAMRHRIRRKIRPDTTVDAALLALTQTPKPKRRLVKQLRGQARRTCRPSAMKFKVTVSATDRRREKAHDAHQRGLVALLATLEELRDGVVSSTISDTSESTASRKVRPNSPRSPEVVEYTITTTITLTAANAGVVLRVASLRGDSSIGISDISFESSHDVDLTDLVTEALANSRGKADAIARGLGCSVIGFEDFELQESPRDREPRARELEFRYSDFSNRHKLFNVHYSRSTVADSREVDWEDLGVSFDLPANVEEYWVTVDWIFEI